MFCDKKKKKHFYSPFFLINSCDIKCRLKGITGSPGHSSAAGTLLSGHATSAPCTVRTNEVSNFDDFIALLACTYIQSIPASMTLTLSYSVCFNLHLPGHPNTVSVSIYTCQYDTDTLIQCLFQSTPVRTLSHRVCFNLHLPV